MSFEVPVAVQITLVFLGVVLVVVGREMGRDVDDGAAQESAAARRAGLVGGVGWAMLLSPLAVHVAPHLVSYVDSLAAALGAG